MRRDDVEHAVAIEIATAMPDIAPPHESSLQKGSVALIEQDADARVTIGDEQVSHPVFIEVADDGHACIDRVPVMRGV